MALPPMRVRWIDRVVGVTIGAGATAWLLRADPEAVDEGAPDPGAIVDPPIASDGRGGAAVPEDPAAAARPVVRPTEAAAPAVPADVDPSAAAPVEAAAGDAALADDPSDTGAPEPAVVPSEAPILPLPRMPGDTRLSSSSRFDAEGPAWILKAAYRVHVRDHHVVGFYRKALADAGLAVTQSEDPPGPDGSVKTYLHGKSARVHAQVGILPRIGELETRVWILWRQRP